MAARARGLCYGRIHAIGRLRAVSQAPAPAKPPLAVGVGHGGRAQGRVGDQVQPFPFLACLVLSRRPVFSVPFSEEVSTSIPWANESLANQPALSLAGLHSTAACCPRHGTTRRPSSRSVCGGRETGTWLHFLKKPYRAHAMSSATTGAAVGTGLTTLVRVQPQFAKPP